MAGSVCGSTTGSAAAPSIRTGAGQAAPGPALPCGPVERPRHTAVATPTEWPALAIDMS